MPPELVVEDARKILEFLLQGSDKKVDLYVAGVRKNRTRKSPGDESGVVIVKAGEKSYVDALKEVKEGVGETKEVMLKGVKKTQKGDILLFVKGGKDGAKLAEEKIRSKTGMTVLVRNRGRRNLFIQGIDGITTKEEIEEAVMAGLGSENKQGVTVTSVTPAQGGSQTATIMATGDIADRLVESGRINIGWLKCRVKERVVLTRCFKCQEFGHRAGACYKCGKNCTYSKRMQGGRRLLLCIQGGGA